MQAARIQRRRCNTSNAMHSGRNVWSRHSLCSKYAPRNTSFFFFVCLSVFHIRTHTNERVPFFAIIGLFLSFSFSVTFSLSFYLSIWYRNPLCAIFRSTTISREFFSNRPASFIAFHTFLPSSILYGSRKMHINTKVHFDASSATPGSLSHCSFDGDRYP